MRTRRPMRLGFELLETRRALAQIQGIVWNDWNHDGFRNKPDDEMRVPDVTVRLLANDGAVVVSTETDSDGVFDFAGIYEGTYQLEFIPIDDVDFTEPVDGPENKDSDVDPATGRTDPFRVEADTKIDWIDAGFYLPGGTGTVSGRVWNDLNGDGIFSVNEPGIKDAVVQLEAPAGGSLVEVRTNRVGAYHFDGQRLLPGSYRLDFRRPDTPGTEWKISPPLSNLELTPNWLSHAGQLDGKTPTFELATATDVSVPPPPQLNAGFYQAAEIVGRVWHDWDVDGVQQSTEAGVAAQTVRLLTVDGLEVARTSTDVAGTYRFVVEPGVYRLGIDLVPHTLLTIAGQGAAEYDSDFDPLSGMTHPFAVADFDAKPVQDAGIYAPFGTESVRGRIWHDLDADGQQDAGEPGLPGVKVDLEYGGLVDVFEVTTDRLGYFVISGARLLPGTYNLDFHRSDAGQPWQISPRNSAGSQTLTDSDAHPLNGKSPPFSLSTGSDVSPSSMVTRDAGFFQFATVLGYVWDDAIANGIHDVEELGVPNVLVELITADGRSVDRQFTQPSGRYEFTEVVVGQDYYVAFTRPHETYFVPRVDSAQTPVSHVNPTTGWTDRFTPASQQLWQQLAGIRGTNQTTGLGGLVWDDLNGDGIREPGEAGLSQISVVAWGPNGDAVAATLTDDRGQFRFEDLAPGGYRVEITLPERTTLSPMNRGTDDAVDSDINRASRLSRIYPIVQNQFEDSVYAGIYRGPFLGDVHESLRITEVAFIGHGNPEFVEVKNVGDRPIDLTGAAFTQGVRFSFGTSNLRSLFPGEYAVIVGDSAALAAKFDAPTINLAGIYQGDLNQAEAVQLRDGQQQLINQLVYDDDWYVIIDNEYQPWTLTVIDEQTEPAKWSLPQNWRPSSFQAGSPGADDPRITPDPGAVIINEVMTKTVDGFNDAIELHNTTDREINIGNWYLGDHTEADDDAPGDNLMRYRIAPDTIIPAGGYLVFSRQSHFANPSDPGRITDFGLSSNGEAVHLIAADELGKMLGYSDSAEFSATEIGMSFGRVRLSDGSWSFMPMSTPTLGSANSEPRIGPVVIDQLLYHAEGDEAVEYVRIRNTSDTTIQLKGDDANWGLSGAISFSFRDTLTAVLPAAATALIVPISPERFREEFGIPSDIQIYGPYDGVLDNAGEEVILYRPGPDGRQILADRMRYVKDREGPSVRGEANIALVRRSSHVIGDEPSNWILSTVSPGTHLGGGLFMQQSFSTLAAAIYGHDAVGRGTWQAAAGDVNGDGVFDSRDLVVIFQAGRYRTDGVASWTEGDWTGDGRFDSSDLVVAFQTNLYL